MALMPDSRQRAPFAHQSSSADLTSDARLASLRSAPPSSQRNPTSPPPTHAGPPPRAEKIQWGGLPLNRKDSNDLTNGGYGDNPYNLSSNGGATYSLDTPLSRRRSLSNPSSRGPSPGPFSLPQISIPGFATIRFVSLCFLWYACSAVSSNTGKVILNNFKYPVTLTIIQFFFVAAYCVVISRKQLGWTGRLRSPTKAILRGTLPMAAFQVGGHIFGSMAISRVPALSPLFTVMAYALFFGVSYSPATYLSLLPLTLGVMLACSFDISFSNFFGLVCALGSTVVFVSQNIFFKKIMPTAGSGETSATAKLDKINLLYFSSGTAFCLMVPLWLYSDAWRLVDLWLHPVLKVGGPSIPFYFFLNGTVHFAQNLLAFAILSSTSPVTYSIASLVKRIAVICMAVVWFKQSVHFVQAMGIGLTAVGLWMYNNAKRDVEKGEKKLRQLEAVRDGMLPTTKADQRVLEGRANLEPMGGFKEVHNSPRPLYPLNYVHGVPASNTTAIKTNGYVFPPPNQSPHTSTDAPYPSPPASISSSPPSDPQPHPNPPPQGPTRQRRMSNDLREVGDHFRLPPSASALRSPPIVEGNETSINSRLAATSAIDASKISVVAGGA
ncbi:hypothetical protein CI109_105524 [Kwoniella shandongensis]|uniref:Sugar phosphate transporter domain-containing protein n=1 Tax=Kwoniella shandongensis TaxID=1734106 RepID=A0AAJ8LKJ8_9TREE